MATNKVTCRLSYWVTEKGKKRKLKFHDCFHSCHLTAHDCMGVVRQQGFWVPSWGKSPRRYIISMLDPKADRTPEATRTAVLAS